LLIDKTTLHPATWSALIDAGWYPDRVVATDIWQSFIKSKDLHWLNSADQFLTTFGGLTLQPFISREMKFGRGACLFDPSSNDCRYWYTEFYEEVLGEKLCPVGAWEQELVLLNSRLQVFAGWENAYLLLLGETPQEALEVIVRAHVYPTVVYGAI
jgi:hypothetical protein